MPRENFNFRQARKQFGSYATARAFGYGMLVAVKQGYGFAWSQAGKYETSGEWLEDVRRRMKDVPVQRHGTFKRLLEGVGEPLKLAADDEPIHGLVVDSNGKPVADARLTLLRVWSGIGDDLTDWREAAKSARGRFLFGACENASVDEWPAGPFARRAGSDRRGWPFYAQRSRPRADSPVTFRRPWHRVSENLCANRSGRANKTLA